ncbi:MAG: hypothetical protein ACI4BB_08780 [Coprococcus sp.]
MTKTEMNNRNNTKNIFGTSIMRTYAKNFYVGKDRRLNKTYERKIFEIVDDYIENA